jgi:hypothetical protein
MPSQSELTLYRSSSTPLVCLSGSDWGWPGNALSASTTLWAGFGESLLYARWVLVWTPGGTGGVRLLDMDDGPTNLHEIAEFHMGYVTPRVDSIDITLELRALGPKRIGHQLVEQAQVYGSWIELQWY